MQSWSYPHNTPNTSTCTIPGRRVDSGYATGRRRRPLPINLLALVRVLIHINESIQHVHSTVHSHPLTNTCITETKNMLWHNPACALQVQRHCFFLLPILQHRHSCACAAEASILMMFEKCNFKQDQINFQSTDALAFKTWEYIYIYIY